MKRNIILSLVLLLSVITVKAAPITSTQAAKNLNSFLYGNTGMKFARGTVKMVTSGDGIQPYYIFNIGSEGGFVILSGDDAAHPVLGYSDKGHFDINNVPANMQSWLDGYARAITQLQKLNLPPRAHKAYATESWEKIPKMVTSEWNQMYPYNNACPDYRDGNGRRPTGCVATAMAQVMYYHKWPVEETVTIPEYSFKDDVALGGNGSRRTERALKPTTFDWDLMTDKYDFYSDSKAEEAVAKLMKYVGHSVKMMYGVYASGAYSEDIADAMVKYFGYKNTAVLVYRDDYKSQTEWEQIMYEELAEGRPILYSGVTLNQEGHQFVCDGYENGFFHINWGWGGDSDGFFKLDILDPDEQGTGGAGSGMAFSEAQSAVIGIQKPVENDYLKAEPLSANIGEEKSLEIVLNNTRKNYISMQFDLKLPEGVTIPSDGVGVPKVRLAKNRFVNNSHKVDVNRLADGTYRFIIYSPTNSVIKGMGGPLVDVTLKLSARMTKGSYPAQISNVVLCNSRLESFDINGCDFSIEAQGETLLLGDADKNGKVEESDVDAIIGNILYKNTGTFDFRLADVDADGMLDIMDAMLTLDIILSEKGADRNIVATSPDNNDMLTMQYNDYGLHLMFKNNTDYKALQFDVTLPSGITINDITPSARTSGFNIMYDEIAEGKYRVLLYSGESLNISAGEGNMAEVISDTCIPEAKISNIVAVTSDLRKLLLKDTDYKVPTGIEEVLSGVDAMTDIYTLQGMRANQDIRTLARGIYVVNGKKIIIK